MSGLWREGWFALGNLPRNELRGYPYSTPFAAPSLWQGDYFQYVKLNYAKLRYVHQHRMVLYVINPIIYYGVNDLLTPTPSPKARHSVVGFTTNNILNRLVTNTDLFYFFDFCIRHPKIDNYLGM